TAKKPMAMLSRMGGMDVEEIAEKDPNAIVRLHVDALEGFQDFHGRRLAFDSKIASDVVRPVGSLLSKLYETFVEEDALLVEVNPLLVTGDREVVALDAKVTVDGNALYRHPDTAAFRNVSAEDPQERMAKERGLTYVKLDGNIGILGNGAGLVMSTLDVVAQAGGRPANFLDAGGGSKAEAIVDAVEVILSNRRYGTDLVAGVTPGKSGRDVDGVPIFDTVHAAVEATGADTSMIFVPPRFAADAILEADDAGVELVICITEGIPVHDMLRVYTHLKRGATRLIGPNCPGVLSPGKANVGIIPAHFFSEGNVGLVSRSGTLTYQIGNELAQRGFGNSTI